MTLTWLLYEFARHPEDQRKVREEIASARAENKGGLLTWNDWDSMSHFNAVIKVSLLLYTSANAVVYQLTSIIVLLFFLFPFNRRAFDYTLYPPL